LRIDAQLTKPARSSALLESLVETIQKRRESPLSMERTNIPVEEAKPAAEETAPAAEATATATEEKTEG
jgi:hypothetical protein